VRALVLGAGSIGSRHARNLARAGVEVVVHDPDGARVSALVAEGVATAVDDRTAAQADLAIVATPTAQHVEDLRWGLERGMHVFVEKPLGATRRDLESARALMAGAGGRAVMVGCNLRFTEGFRLLAKEVGEAGRLLSVEAAFGWHLPSWRPDADYRRSYSASRAMGGGVILDAIHEVDYVLSLAGPVAAVSAAWRNSGALEIDVEDVAELTLAHAGGVLSHIHLDYLQPAYTRWCRATATDATVTWDYAAGCVRRLQPGRVEVLADGLDQDANAMYVAELDHFLAAVQDGSPTLNDLPTAVAALDVALTALEKGAPG